MESDVTELPIHDRLLAWFEVNKKQVLWGSVSVLAIGLTVGVVIWHEGEKEAAANLALSKITTLGFIKPDQSQSLDALLKVAADHPKTDAAGRALLLAGANAYEQGKYPQAKSQFERFLREYRESPLLPQALFGIAACLDAQGKMADAATAYNDLVQHYSSDNVAPPARLGLARLYEKQNKLEQARDAYLEVNRNYPYGSIGTQAGMLLDELLSKHPDLNPRRPVATNAINLRPLTQP